MTKQQRTLLFIGIGIVAIYLIYMWGYMMPAADGGPELDLQKMDIPTKKQKWHGDDPSGLNIPCGGGGGQRPC